MKTAARVWDRNNAHWYCPDGTPLHWVARADGTGNRASTLADARKLNLLPSPTSILRLLDKPELHYWKVEQAVLAVLTTPRLTGEADDAFVTRVLKSERVQDQEAAIARDLGTQIHAAMHNLALGSPVFEEMKPWVAPAWAYLNHPSYGPARVMATEKVLVGDGYAGCTDLILAYPAYDLVVDFKATRSVPTREPWTEHRLQAAAYAKAYGATTYGRAVRAGVLYISSQYQGLCVLHECKDWLGDYHSGFEPLLKLWGWVHGYQPSKEPPTKGQTK